MSRVEHHEQDNEQIFPRGALASRWSCARQGIAKRCPEMGDPVDFGEARLCGAPPTNNQDSC